MATTAEINSLLEPWLKNTEMSSDVQKKIKDVYYSLLDNLAKNAKNIKLETGTIDLGSFLGADKSIIAANSSKYTALQKEVLDKIQKVVKTSGVAIDSTGIKLSDILGVGPKDSYLTAKKFQSTRKTILDKIISQLSDKAFQGFKFDDGVKISDILGILRKDDRETTKKFQMVRKRLLDVLYTQLYNPKVYKNLKFDNGIKLGDLLGDTPEMGLFTRLKFYSVRARILKVLEDQVAKTPLVKEGVKISDILGDLPGLNIFARMRLNKLRSKIFTLLEEQVKKTEKGEDSSPGALTASDDKTKGTEGGIRVFEQEATSVSLVNVDEDAMKQLEKIFGVNKAILPGIKKKDEKEGAGGDMFGLLKWLAPFAVLLGGLGALVYGLLDTGPFKGLITLIGKGGVIIGLKMVAKKLGMVLAKTCKAIPIIGTIIDLADAFFRFKNGDTMGGIISVVGGLGGLLDLAVPGLGRAISWGASILNAFLDYKAGGSSEEASANKVKMLSGGAGSAIIKVLILSALKWGAKLGKCLKFIPFLGPIINLAEAYFELKDGDILKGLISLASGIIGFIPVYGTAISLGIDIINAFIKPKEERDKEAAEGGSEGGGIMDMLWSGAKWIGEKIVAILRYLPIVGTAMRLYETYQAFSGGEIMKGLVSLAGALATILPMPLGGFVAAGIDYLSDMLFSPAEDSGEGESSGSSKSLWEIFKDKIAEIFQATMKRLIDFGSGLGNIFTGNFQEGLGQIASATEGIPLIGWIFGTLNDWFGQDSDTEGTPEESGIDNRSMWQIFKDYIYEKVTAAFHRLVEFGSGLKNIFTGNFGEGLGNLANATEGIPLIGGLFSTLNDWFNSPNEEQVAGEIKTPRKSLIESMKEAAFKKMKAVWDGTPDWVKWGLRRILPQHLIDKLDAENPPDENEGLQVPPPQDESVMAPQGRANTTSNRAGSFTAVNDFSGEFKPGSLIGSFKDNPVVNTTTDYVIGAKKGGPIETKLESLVQSVNTNMRSITQEIAQAVNKAMSNQAPSIISTPSQSIIAPSIAPSLETGKAPSYAMSKVYDQRAKFYALYGG